MYIYGFIKRVQRVQTYLRYGHNEGIATKKSLQRRNVSFKILSLVHQFPLEGESLCGLMQRKKQADSIQHFQLCYLRSLEIVGFKKTLFSAGAHFVVTILSTIYNKSIHNTLYQKVIKRHVSVFFYSLSFMQFPLKMSELQCTLVNSCTSDLIMLKLSIISYF